MKMSKARRPQVRSVGVLCSGGDAPGMNAAIRAVVRYGIAHGLEVHGIYRGYAGLLEGHMEPMSLRSVANIIQRGGTILKTSRCKPFFKKEVRAEAVHILRRNKVDALIVIGGEGSYSGAHLLCAENDYPVIGLPGTIDNDIVGTDYTIGFDTAVNTAVEAIDKIRDTASSHDRIFLVEVMGRTSTEIAFRVAMSGGAETVYIPSRDPQCKKLIETLDRSQKADKLSSIVVTVEGDHAGYSNELAVTLKKKAGFDSRVAILGHLQRGGSPTALDRFMASVMGAHAVQAVLDGKRSLAVSQVNGKIALVPFKVCMGKHKEMDQDLLRIIHVLAS